MPVHSSHRSRFAAKSRSLPVLMGSQHPIRRHGHPRPGSRHRVWDGPLGSAAMTTEWDAATYDRVSDPQARWGAAVLDRLQLEGDERILDAGCGSGRVTAL